MPLVQEDLMGHWGAMVRVARSVLGSRDDAVECAAAALAQVLERPPVGVVNMEAFLVTVAKRRAIDMLRARQRARLRDHRLHGMAQCDVIDIAEDVVAQAEARWVDAAARRLLRPRIYEILRLVADGVPTGEIAQRFGTTERAVESHLLRARRTLRAALTSALAALGLLGAATRRSLGPSAALATVAAAVLVLVPGTHPGPARVDPPAPRFALPQHDAYVAHSVTQPRTAAVRTGPDVIASGPRQKAPGPRPRPPRATVAQASPGGTRLTVYREDSGTDEEGPLDALVACVANLRAEVGGTVGC